jgi:hypothetical protein
MNSSLEKAIEKIDLELKEFIGSQQSKIVAKATAETLKTFSQNEEFAKAVLEKSGTLTECINDILKNIGSAISDLEVYQKAAQFYFPLAKVNFLMTIELGTGENNHAASSEKKINISLDDLF